MSEKATRSPMSHIWKSEINMIFQPVIIFLILGLELAGGEKGSLRAKFSTCYSEEQKKFVLCQFKKNSSDMLYTTKA